MRKVCYSRSTPGLSRISIVAKQRIKKKHVPTFTCWARLRSYSETHSWCVLIPTGLLARWSWDVLADTIWSETCLFSVFVLCVTVNKELVLCVLVLFKIDLTISTFTCTFLYIRNPLQRSKITSGKCCRQQGCQIALVHANSLKEFVFVFLFGGS